MTNTTGSATVTLTSATAERTGTEAVVAARTEAEFSAGSPLFYVFGSG